MSNHPEKTKERILASPAPRDIEWTHFITMWENYADRVQQESGDRLAVDMNSHRQVFHRQHEDVEHARHLFAAHETTEGSGPLFVTLTDEDARFYDFDLSAHDIEVDQYEHEKNPDARGHHTRTVEKKTGREDENDLKRFFYDLAADLNKDAARRDFVLLGHGTGKSNAAQAFAEYLEKDTHPLHAHVIAVGDIGLSSGVGAVMRKQPWSDKRERQYEHIRDGREQRGGQHSHDGPQGRTRDQLYADANPIGIDGRSTMDKDELERAVQCAERWD